MVDKIDMEKLKGLEFSDDKNKKLMMMFPDPQFHPVLFSIPQKVLAKLLKLAAENEKMKTLIGHIANERTHDPVAAARVFLMPSMAPTTTPATGGKEE